MFPLCFIFFFSISALTGADLPKRMLIAYLLHPSLFNLLTDHFLFRAQQQIHFLSPVNLFTIWANAIGATLPPPENSASLHIKKKKKKKKF